MIKPRSSPSCVNECVHRRDGEVESQSPVAQVCKVAERSTDCFNSHRECDGGNIDILQMKGDMVSSEPTPGIEDRRETIDRQDCSYRGQRIIWQQPRGNKAFRREAARRDPELIVDIRHVSEREKECACFGRIEINRYQCISLKEL